MPTMKLGDDFISKPFEKADAETSLASTVHRQRVGRELPSLYKLQPPVKPQLLLGESRPMAEVRDLIERVADTDVTILICGESGTGKELVARSLCASSPRREKPFIKVNCAALPAELLESELFGFERGAFTGAIQHKPGRFEYANHGTMFLDEVSEMSPALQAKLLQVLQDGEFSRLGGKGDVHVDVRIIAATNRDLERSVAEGRFREDLFFRLNVVSIRLPPLRQRREEIPALSDYFLKKYSVQYCRPYPAMSNEMKSLFMQYDWPGNVRELENMMKRAVVLGGEEDIRRDISKRVGPSPERPTTPDGLLGRSNGGDIGPHEDPRPPVAANPAEIATAAYKAGNCSLKDVARTAARQAERELISCVLHETRWNRKQAAEILKISYKALLYKIKDCGLDKGRQARERRWP